jgi:Flp pilus assembly protein TadG
MRHLPRKLSKLIGRIVLRCVPVRTVRRFSADEQGATAVEFAIVALPFFALMFAIIETALVFFAGQMLESAVRNSGRLIRTGQAQEQGLTADTFKTAICGQVDMLLKCSTGLFIDVQRYDTFAEIDLGPPVDDDGVLTTVGFGYNPGGGGDIVVVRAFYEWPTFVNQLGNDLGTLSNGKHLLAATAAFRNEPFPW